MYRSVDDGLVLRAAILRPGQVPAWPDLTGPDATESWQRWLHEAVEVPGFAAALRHASPALTARLDQALRSPLTPPDMRRLVLAVMRYLLRAVTRATPYGLFAGVAAATAGRAGRVRLGGEHHPVARLRSGWLNALIEQVEADPDVRLDLMMGVNNLLIERGEHFLLHHRASTDPRGAPLHLRIRATAAIRVLLDTAAEPIRWGDLIEKAAAECGVSRPAVDRLTSALVAQRILLTSARPPSTATDPLAHLAAELEDLEPAGKRLTLLRQLQHQENIHVSARSAAHPMDLAGVSVDGPAWAVDLRVDGDLVLPRAVTAEARRAAIALTRLAGPISIGWANWHARFLDRYGLHAAVPVQQVLDADVGLGYPMGFTGAEPSTSPALTDRDRRLLGLAQRAALHHQQEIVLDDALLDTLTGPLPTHVQPTAELTVRVHAATMNAIERGDFRLSVVRASEQAFATAGRILDLFDAADQRRIAERASSLPRSTRGALLAQLSAVTRYGISQDVARTPQVLPYVLPVGEYHRSSPDTIELRDLAVTADAERLHLVSVSRRRVVEPVKLNSVEPVRHLLPLARFLAEAPGALAARCAPFEWPAARSLPFVPALRYGRTLLSPARWLLGASELPDRRADGEHWNQALTAWLAATGCPAAVSLGAGDEHIGLNLSEAAHRALLRDHLIRGETAILRATVTGDEWIGVAHEIVIPLASSQAPRAFPARTWHVVDGRDHAVLPGGTHQYLRIHARPEQQTTILTQHLHALTRQLPPGGTCWFQRYIDPEPHLRLRLEGLPAEPSAAWIRDLVAADLTRRVQFDTDFPESGRFGGPAGYAATLPVFVADSAAALAQLTVTSGRRAPVDWAALTAASMIDLATAVLGDTHDARQWLLAHTRPHRPAPARAVYDQAVRLADPAELALIGGGDQVLAAWERRRTTIATWRETLAVSGAVAPAELLPDLLHLHHVRIAGPDLDSERACLHLARAAALSATTRSRP